MMVSAHGMKVWEPLLGSLFSVVHTMIVALLACMMVLQQEVCIALL